MSTAKLILTSTAIAMAFIATSVSQDSLAARPQARRGTAQPGERRGAAPRSATAERIEKRAYVFKETNTKLEYDVFVSTKVKKGNKSPLVIVLHGAGVSPDQMLSFVTDAAQDGGYIAVAPMGYALEGWYGVQGRVPRDAPANLSEMSEKDVMNVLDLARKEFNIDEQRIYLLGQSMGGAGALHLGVKYHDIWAAVGATAPAAGGMMPEILASATEVPMILVHGDADQSVSVTQTRRWADKMRELKMTYEYYEIPGAAHRDAITSGARRVFAFFDKHSRPTKTN
jgi:predicted peptidase